MTCFNSAWNWSSFVAVRGSYESSSREDTRSSQTFQVLELVGGTYQDGTRVIRLSSSPIWAVFRLIIQEVYDMTTWKQTTTIDLNLSVGMQETFLNDTVLDRYCDRYFQEPFYDPNQGMKTNILACSGFKGPLKLNDIISKPRYHYNTIITYLINYTHYNTIITLL